MAARTLRLVDRFPRAAQLARFAAVSLANNLLGYGIYLLVTLWIEPKFAVTLLYPVGVLTGYVSHARLVFAYEGRHASGLVRYIVAHLLGYALNVLLLYAFVDRLGIAHQLVQFVAMFAVGGFMYAQYRLWVFPPGGQPGAGAFASRAGTRSPE